jgi:glycosyltransferase involved in cell wall biosynthesis
VSEVPRRLRVLHVVEVFGSGVGIVAKTLAERQAEAGEQVAIAHGRCPETPAEVRGFVAAEVELFELPWERRSIGEQLRAGKALRTLVGWWRPDVVHLHSSFAGMVGGLALPSAMSSVYTPHGYSFTMRDRGAGKRAAFRALERFTAARVDAVGAVSEAEAADARRVAAAAKVCVVPNGIPELDDDFEVSREVGGDRPRVITIGRIAEQHIPAETAAILADLADLADVSWVGGNGRNPELDDLVRSRGVDVTGWVERDEVQNILSSADCCLHWTAWDGLPLSILEALACDVVVVARDIPATREILGPRQVCDSPAAAEGLLRQILTDVDLREELLAEQRRRRVRFGSRRMAAGWREVYDRLAAPATASAQSRRSRREQLADHVGAADPGVSGPHPERLGSDVLQ